MSAQTDPSCDTTLFPCFTTNQLEYGTFGQVNSQYRFFSVMLNIDALVTITGKYNTSLVAIDLNNEGDLNAFQPQVMLTNQDYWGTEGFMDFRIAFVVAGTLTPVNMSNWSATAMDIDGDGYRLRESVGFEDPETYRLENNTLIQFNAAASLEDMVVFETSSINNLAGINQTATEYMVNTTYKNRNKFTYKTRVIDNGYQPYLSNAADRKFSLSFSPCHDFDNPTIFPVEYSLLDAKFVGGKVNLAWSTTKEVNNDRFEVERSIDGRNFTKIGQVSGAGNTTVEQQYFFTDYTPSLGLTYYRLKQVDIDGTFEYSRIMTAAPSQKMIQYMTLYPNPAVTEVNVQISGNEQAEQIRLMDMQGHAVEIPFQRFSGFQWKLDVSDLAPGVYLLKAQMENDILVEKLVIK
ncbi:MAG: T9SS type A sorting domain-containing protein [Bacteroidota bacterium]